jgi:hypothetical protein
MTGFNAQQMGQLPPEAMAGFKPTQLKAFTAEQAQG